MDSPLSDTLDCLDRLKEAARRGDWTNAAELAASLPQQALPPQMQPSREELGEYLRHLKEALIVAKASRAHAAASLVRLQAAARFNHASRDFAPGRQDFADLADF